MGATPPGEVEGPGTEDRAGDTLLPQEHAVEADRLGGGVGAPGAGQAERKRGEEPKQGSRSGVCQKPSRGVHQEHRGIEIKEPAVVGPEVIKPRQAGTRGGQEQTWKQCALAKSATRIRMNRISTSSQWEFIIYVFQVLKQASHAAGLNLVPADLLPG
mmetsp:Transcript_100297/g.312513  ORF Transcript_100297/g.312513 Transcript_100297/m.312513 type:complete len:158 (-) Transcript_100297:236-709(-)